jgi:hypothetical protein
MMSPSDSAACTRCGRERLYRNMRDQHGRMVCIDEDDCAASLLRAPADELWNAIWLREHPATIIASAMHGGHAKGYALAVSHVSTDAIRARLAGAPDSK